MVATGSLLLEYLTSLDDSVPSIFIETCLRLLLLVGSLLSQPECLHFSSLEASNDLRERRLKIKM